MSDRVYLRVNEEEHEQIRLNAEASNRTMNAYIKEMALNKAILDFNYEQVDKHTQEIIELKNDLNKVLHTIMVTEEAYNGDIQTILQLMKELVDSEKKFLQAMQRDREQKRKEIKKVLNSKKRNQTTEQIAQEFIN